MAADGDVELFEDGGVTYELKLSKKPSARNGGYEGVVKQGRLFYAKPTLKRGAGQTMLPDGGFGSAQQAALKIAKYWLAPYVVEKKNPDRAGKGKGKVRRQPCRTPVPLAYPRVLCVLSQKRQLLEAARAEAEVDDLLPTWVTCMHSLILFQSGVEPPDEIKLTKKEAKGVQRARAWAARTNAARSAERPAQPLAALAVPSASPPPTAYVEAVRPPYVPPAAHAFDSAMLAKAAQLKHGPKVGL